MVHVPFTFNPYAHRPSLSRDTIITLLRTAGLQDPSNHLLREIDNWDTWSLDASTRVLGLNSMAIDWLNKFVGGVGVVGVVCVGLVDVGLVDVGLVDVGIVCVGVVGVGLVGVG